MIEVRGNRFFTPLVAYIAILVLILYAAATIGPFLFSQPTGERAYAWSSETGPQAAIMKSVLDASVRAPLVIPADGWLQSRSASVI